MREETYARKRIPYPIWMTFCKLVGFADVSLITCATFAYDGLRGLGVAVSQNLPLPIGFRRRPYNTVALLCECVIQFSSSQVVMSI